MWNERDHCVPGCVTTLSWRFFGAQARQMNWRAVSAQCTQDTHYEISGQVLVCGDHDLSSASDLK